MFDERQEGCAKRIPLVTDNVLYEQKPFYKVQVDFVNPP